jgi:hypothetical protein
MSSDTLTRFIDPFNGPIEIGLRGLALLTAAYPDVYSLQRLVVFDYLVVHSDDLPEGPTGLHPKTPHRGGELLVRRDALRDGILLYQSRGLIETRYDSTGIFFVATESSAAFLDALTSEYVAALRERAEWLVNNFGSLSDNELQRIVRRHLGEWGAEFEMESVLWSEETA